MTAPAARTHIPTSLVGSYAQPNWLLDRDRLRDRFPPRVRATRAVARRPARTSRRRRTTRRGWRSRDQERAGLDIITDGEMRRESYSNRFATALDGVDIDNPGTALDRSGHPNPVPRVVGPVARRHPVQVRDAASSCRAHTSRTTKMTVPGPFTMSQQAQDDYYGAPAELGMAYAEAVREEILDLFAAGADIVQIDEPYMQARPEPARAYGARRAEARDRRHRRHDRRAHLLRLRGDHPRAPERLLVPARARRDRGRPGQHRDRPVGARPRGARRAAGQDDHPRRARPLDGRGRDARAVAERIRRAFPHDGARGA